MIDPVLSYSRRFGGEGFEQASAIAVDKDGNSYITGSPASESFPTVNALQPSLRGPTDAFVMKLNAEGGVLYSTFLGGTSGDAGRDIAVDKAGNAYVTGSTGSPNFPTTPGAFQTSHSDRTGIGDEAFVAKLNAAGNNLVYSTYLGGSASRGGFTSDDLGLVIAVDSSGNAYVAGSTFSLDFPVKKALQPRFNMTETGGVFLCFTTSVPSVTANDGFVTKLNRAGSGLVFSTYFGGTGSEEIRDIVLDSAGNICIAGRTCSPNFPRVNATQTIYGDGISDAFVSKLAASGSRASSRPTWATGEGTGRWGQGSTPRVKFMWRETLSLSCSRSWTRCSR